MASLLNVGGGLIFFEKTGENNGKVGRDKMRLSHKSLKVIFPDLKNLVSYGFSNYYK